MFSIPGYTITEELYNGTRTLVYRAIRALDEKPVVIKLLKNPHPSFNELLQFRNQYTIAKDVNFPGIIQTYSLENYQNSYALVMEDMGGISLKQYFNSAEISCIASLEEFLKIAISLCDTLDFLYSRRIIHKDIKPANILIHPQTKQVKLIDFSIASLLLRETQTLINPNVLEGTLSYISPEQTGRMNRGVDYRTDFYSLGVTFYELLTGELPFKSDDAMELVHCHIAKTPPSINKLDPNSFDLKGKEVHEINKPLPNSFDLKGKEVHERNKPLPNSFDLKGKEVHEINKPLPNSFDLKGKEVHEINKPLPNSFDLKGKEVHERNKPLPNSFDLKGKEVHEINKPLPNSFDFKGKEVHEINKPLPNSFDLKGKEVHEINKPLPNPLLVKERGQEFPQVLSDIVMKLMAKNAEDRYQSAWGLKHDLETCLKQLRETGKIESFNIAQWDICDRFTIPEKLYGRESEVEELLAAFDRVSKGNSTLTLVAGFSGIGKTALVNEVHKPIVKQRGYFIKGKFDQFNRNIPYFAFVQAFRDLMVQLRTESDAQLSSWKNNILQALGENGKVIIDVIPELEQIIGKQPPAPELSGAAAQNRFNLLLQKFIQVFTTKEHPLVIFLDDLQWADGASLSLMQLLMSESESGYLLLIGAYRDNEVFPAHPLMLTLEEVKKIKGGISTISLTPLSQESLNKLVADTLNCLPENAQPLTQLVYQKTKGNPFFSTQFFRYLHEDGLIAFHPPDFPLSNGASQGGWVCDISQVKALTLTDDVVEFMSLQLQKLPQETQDVLKLAACIGNQFDLSILAIVCEQSVAETAASLWKALQEGLILPQSEIYKFYLEKQTSEIEQIPEMVSYKFLHDRVQQAAYSLIPLQDKKATHLKIGQLLLNNIDRDKLEENIFKIVNQLNIGIELISEQFTRNQLAKLNLIAGCKAKIATAYSAAVNYLKLGRNLLTTASWEDCYELTLALYEEAAEAAYLSTNFEEMNQLAQEIHGRAKTLLDQIKLYEIEIQAHMAQDKFLEAIQTGLQVLEFLGICFPESPNDSDIQTGMETTFANLGERNPLELADIPLMCDRSKLAALRILNCVCPCAYQAAPQLLPLLVMEQVNLSIKYGNSAISPTGYAMWGLILCGIVEDIDTGYNFGKLALSLLESFECKEIQAGTIFVVNADVRHYREHIKETLAPLQSAYSIGLETGDLNFAALATYIYAYHAFLSGNNLLELSQKIADYNQVLHKFQQINTLNLNQALQQAILNLVTDTEEPCQLIGEAYNWQEMLPQHQQANDATAIFYVYFNQMILNYLFANFEQALENAIEAEKYLVGVIANFVVPVFYFYDSLVQLATHKVIDKNLQVILNRVEANQQKMQKWAHYAPMNFQHKYDLVEAEKLRILGKNWQASELYDLTIKEAKENEYLSEEALANELAAKFYLNWDKDKIAQVYIQEAYYCYARWGAKAKTDDLEKRYPQLLAAILQTQTTSSQSDETYFQTHQTIQINRSSSSICEALDMSSILKATRALSSEIQLEELISTLLKIVIENAGADKAALVLLKEDILSLEAIVTDGIVTDLSIPYETSPDIPILVLNYVKCSLEAVVLDNATTKNYFMADEYLIQQQPRSLLCLPILDRGKFTGLLYLENKLTFGAFTPERLEVVNILCSQAAISLGNARLYKTLEESETKFRAFVENVNDLIYSVDLNGNFTYLSPQFKQMFGYEVDEFIHKSFAPLIHPEDLAKVVSANQQVFETGIKYSGLQFRNKHKNGSWLWVICNNSPIENAEGKVTGLRGIARDITDNKLAEEAVAGKSQELEKTLEELQQAQLQMVQNEKMATLGNLVAGVAHEVNNPIGFLKGSISNAQEYIQDLFAHIECYQQSYPSPEEEVIENAEEIDLEFVTEDLPKLLNSMELATERITDISNSLRTFSRADTAEKVACNIHEGIDSTILILKYRLKANDKRPAIEVIKEYGNLPQVKCFLGQLNQVFMNIIANAIDALDITNEGKTFAEIEANPHKIMIITELSTQKNAVVIIIKDNGSGMPESIRERIFDNLFTTKGVGKGTGLGLAIAKQIVEETHHGKLSCNSTLGEGTEFVIELPIES